VMLQSVCLIPILPDVSTVCRVASCLENLEISKNLAVVRELAKGYGNVRERILPWKTVYCILPVLGYISV